MSSPRSHRCRPHGLRRRARACSGIQHSASSTPKRASPSAQWHPFLTFPFSRRPMNDCGILCTIRSACQVATLDTGHIVAGPVASSAARQIRPAHASHTSRPVRSRPQTSSSSLIDARESAPGRAFGTRYGCGRRFGRTLRHPGRLDWHPLVGNSACFCLTSERHSARVGWLAPCCSTDLCGTSGEGDWIRGIVRAAEPCRPTGNPIKEH